MKHIVVIAYNMRTAVSYGRQISSLLGEDVVQVDVYALERELPASITADAVLLSAHFIYSFLGTRLRDCRHVLIADITLPLKALDALRALPAGSRAMLVNTTMEMAIETINQIRNAGIYQVELVPVYPGMEEIPPLPLAVTPGERELVPPSVTEVLDLQDRVLSARTIAGLAVRLDLTQRLQRREVEEYFQGLVRTDWGVDGLLSQVYEQERRLDLLRQNLEELEQSQIRRPAAQRGHVARHSFDDILTRNPRMQQLKETARRMAASNSSIVIYGRSGTGKELFAQSIHNASPRREAPFIAINCASIPENLLESELFGYSEGAFTGAKKGGKRGYFELAHRGTLFLDEIGEMDLGLQARILRVLQEKEITRVGGDSVIRVDVRILSASNKRLLDLVRQNRFREDLYYRLNVLSLEIPPLRDRREDVPLLLRHFQEQLGAVFSLTPAAWEFLGQYPWPGNVRELGNFVERLSYLGKPVLDREDVASQLDGQPEAESGAGRSGEGEGVSAPLPEEATASAPLLEHFLLQERERRELYAAILSLLHYNRESGVHQGRGGLSRSLREKGVMLSEQQVRTHLRVLSRYGLVTVQAGRRGTEITELGQQVWKKMVEK